MNEHHEHLTATEIYELKNSLVRHLSALKASQLDNSDTSDIETQVNLAGKVHDRGEESVAGVMANLNYNLSNMQLKELHAVESALTRLNRGYYGYCVDCDEKIPYRRLLAEPEALRCIDCQQIYERQNH